MPRIARAAREDWVSSGSSWSLAARSESTLSGTAVDHAAASISRPAARRARATSMTNNGLPPVRPAARATTSAVGSAPVTPAMSSPTDDGEIPASSRTTSARGSGRSWPPRSVRITARSTSSRSNANERSTAKDSLSAHCTSSSTTTTSLDEAAIAWRDSTTASRRSDASAGADGSALAMASASEPRSMPARRAARSTRRQGSSVPERSSELVRPHSARRSEVTSCTSRVFPMPGSPRTMITDPRPGVPSSARRRSAARTSRPTNPSPNFIVEVFQAPQWAAALIHSLIQLAASPAALTSQMDRAELPATGESDLASVRRQCTGASSLLGMPLQMGVGPSVELAQSRADSELRLRIPSHHLHSVRRSTWQSPYNSNSPVPPSTNTTR